MKKVKQLSKALCLAVLLLLYSASVRTFAQTDSLAQKKDSLSGFDKFNKKAEALFKVIPVPIVSYSQEDGNVFGLAKFNVLDLSKKDTISKASKLSEVVTFSTKGRINASVATELVFHENKYVAISYINYRKEPDYIYEIGNTLNDHPEFVVIERFVFAATLMRLVAKDIYIGPAFQLDDYFKISPDSNSFLVKDNVTGLKGGVSTGLGISAAYDTRNNRYNPLHGAYVISSILFYPSGLGPYPFTKFSVDARKYFNPLKKQVIALQVTNSYTNGVVPFYELPQLGGSYSMRGYYQGGLRDNVLLDGQLEYRVPVWNIFGVTGWIGTGRVAESYEALGIDGFHINYGFGLRIKVDSKHDTNLRLDYGCGTKGIHGFILNFGEAF
jgi:outer membrane protein assembly factor BamA